MSEVCCQTSRLSDIQHLIQEGDLLLFRAGKFPSIGWWITGYTGGIHSHVGLASWNDDDLMIIEQREFKGGREVKLASQLDENTIVDVYRVAPSVTIFQNEEWVTKHFTPEIAKQVTKIARNITGKEYGWRNILEIFKGYAPFYRFIYRPKNGDEHISTAYVCSTVASYSYRIAYVDPVPGLSDRKTAPDDLARSALFFHQFAVQGK